MNQDKTTGKCLSMCPKKEIELRERENLLHPFEILRGHMSKGMHLADREKCIKEYRRPTVGKQEIDLEELRPASVLVRTTDYLIDRVCTLQVSWADVYEYVFDRLRAVRQDLVIQEIEGETAVHVLEHAVRFHIYSDYRLCTDPPAVFDQKINDQHTQECLKRLINLYNASPEQSVSAKAECEATYLLFNLGEADAIKHYYSLDEEYRSNKTIRQAYEMSIACMTNNWSRLFRLLPTLQSPVHICAVHRHFPSIQKRALQTMNTAYSSKNLKFPLDKLTQMLWLNTETEMQTLCTDFGINVIGTNAQFLKSNFNSKTKIVRSHSDIISSRLRNYTIPRILHGDREDSLSDEFSNKCQSTD